MTTGRINQVACRAPPGRRTLPPHRAEGEYAATPAKLAAPPTARRHLHPTRSAPRGKRRGASQRHRGLQHVRAQKGVSSDGRDPPPHATPEEVRAQTRHAPAAASRSRRERAFGKSAQTRAGPAATNRVSTPSREALVGGARHAAAPDPNPSDRRRLHASKRGVLAHAARSEALENARSDAQTRSDQDAAATRAPWCAGSPRRRNPGSPEDTRHPRRRARCTRRFAPNACDRSRNHSPNQLVPGHAAPARTHQRIAASHTCWRNDRGRRAPNLKATRCRAPRGLQRQSRRRAGEWPAAPVPREVERASSLTAAPRLLALPVPAQPHRASAHSALSQTPQNSSQLKPLPSPPLAGPEKGEVVVCKTSIKRAIQSDPYTPSEFTSCKEPTPTRSDGTCA